MRLKMQHVKQVIKAKGLVDVAKGTLIANPFVMIEADRITAVGKQEEMPEMDPGAAVLDLKDKYLLPGLINSHAHACFPSGGKQTDAMVSASNEILVLMAAKNARLELMSGVTTLRDCGGRDGVMFELRKAMEMGIYEGPRLFLSGHGLTMTGGHGSRFGEQVDGADSVIKSVRRLFKEGADFIKLIATGGGTPGTYPGYASLSVPEIAAAVEAAHRIGKRVAAHCRGIPGIRNVIQGGIDHIEHACFELPDGRLKFDPVLAEKIAEADMYVTPTIHLYRDLIEAFNRKKEEGTLLPAQEKRLKILPSSVEEKLKALEWFLKAGVKCVAGNDAGLPFTGFGLLWQELKTMVDGGMTPVQAITAASKTAAEAMNLYDQIGSIEVGKQADIVAVDEDPTRDIASLTKVSLVMKDGNTYLCNKV